VGAIPPDNSGPAVAADLSGRASCFKAAREMGTGSAFGSPFAAGLSGSSQTTSDRPARVASLLTSVALASVVLASSGLLGGAANLAARVVFF